MSIQTTYRQKLRSLRDSELTEPSLTWGLRMAVATVIPVVWGLSTGHPEAGEWIALSADCICWVVLKGTFAQRFRVLIGGAVLTLLSATLGSITGGSLTWSLICMLGVAFVSGLFRNLGERGSGLSLCLYVMFLIANAHPVAGADLGHRVGWVALGGVWNTVIGMLTALFVTEQQPYRRTIAGIWHKAGDLMLSISAGWDGKSTRANQRELYIAEKEVRAAIDLSFAFHERAAHQLNDQGSGKPEYELAQVRKAAALTSAHMLAMSGELEQVRLSYLDEGLKIRLAKLMRALRTAADRMGVLVLTRRQEEALLMQDALDGIRIALTALDDYKKKIPAEDWQMTHRVTLLAKRCGRLMERSAQRLEAVAEAPMFRAYPVMKTIYVLHPKHWWRSLRLLFSIDSHTARYAVRTAVAATVAQAIAKGFRIDHGYWLPFTVIIVMQPYFVATFRKAIDRLIGTLAGGVAGGLLLLLPAHLHLKEVMLFFSAIAMIHFYKAQYKVSAFFITLNLVLLFSVFQELDQEIILVRAGLTLGGAAIGVIAGFLLLPAWDRKWLPRFLARALERNWIYFVNTFSGNAMPWTRCKRIAEVANSNAFDSFNRAVQEPGGIRRDYAAYYQFITHNVRITRELNNFHLENEGGSDTEPKAAMLPETEQRIRDCAALFQTAMQLVAALTGRPLKANQVFPDQITNEQLNEPQKLYLNRLHTELTQLLATLQALSPDAAVAANKS